MSTIDKLLSIKLDKTIRSFTYTICFYITYYILATYNYVKKLRISTFESAYYIIITLLGRGHT